MEQEILQLLTIRNNVHLEHWATESFAAHKALNEFYDGLLDLIDTFVETYQGRYGRLNIVGVSSLKKDDGTSLADKAYGFCDTIEKKLKKEDTDLMNIVADIKGLCNHTKYLLTLK